MNSGSEVTERNFILLSGIKYKIDKYIGTCDQNLVVIGDNFVKQSNNNAFAIALMSAAEFFHLENAQTQYVGKVINDMRQM